MTHSIPVLGPARAVLAQLAALLLALATSTSAVALAYDDDLGARALASPARPDLERQDLVAHDDPEHADAFGDGRSLEVSLGVGATSSLAVGAVLLPELSLALHVDGVLAQVDTISLGVLALALSLDAWLVTPREAEVAPVAELSLGAVVPVLIPEGWQASPRALASLGLGLGYVLHPQLALRAVVSPALGVDDTSAVLYLSGALTLVARV
jgi:hypothetical protein